MNHLAKIALFIAILLPSISYAQVAGTFVTPNGTVIDWYGNVISQPVAVQILNTPAPKKVISAFSIPKKTTPIISKCPKSGIPISLVANCK